MTESTGISGVIFRLRGAACAGVLLAVLGVSGASAAQGEGAYFEIGSKGLYSSGLSEPYYAYKIDAAAGYSSALYGVLLGYLRHQHYQLTDGSGSYTYADFNQARAEIACIPADVLEFTFGARYSAGDSSFRGVEYSGELSFDFDAFSIGGEYVSFRDEYALNGRDFKSRRRLYSLDAAVTVSDTAWIDAGLDYDRIDFETTGAVYTRTAGRVGSGISASRSMVALFGVNYGRDSSDYTLFGADIGIDFRPFRGIKASIFYLFTYYQTPSYLEIEGGGGHGGGAGSGYSRDVNPFMRSSLLGKSFFAHTLSAGASLLLR